MVWAMVVRLLRLWVLVGSMLRVLGLLSKMAVGTEGSADKVNPAG